ncbi:hypothetical protein ACTFIV_010583 [Dictyostelium citrinum]
MSCVVKKVPTRKVIKTSVEKHNPKYINTWEGNERLKRILIKLTKEYLSSSNSLLDDCSGEELIHNTIAATNGNTHKIKENRVDASVLVSQKLVKLIKELKPNIIYQPVLDDETKNLNSSLRFKYNLSLDDCFNKHYYPSYLNTYMFNTVTLEMIIF